MIHAVEKNRILSAAFTVVCVAFFLSGCRGNPRPVASFADDIHKLIPAGWSISTSNNQITIRSEQNVTLIGRVSRPAFLSEDELAKEFGQTTNYQVTVIFVSRLSEAELNRLRNQRSPYEYVLDHGAPSKFEYLEAQIGYKKHRVPSFYTEDYSIYVERPEERFLEVYPSAAAAQIDSLMKLLTKVFRAY